MNLVKTVTEILKTPIPFTGAKSAKPSDSGIISTPPPTPPVVPAPPPELPNNPQELVEMGRGLLAYKTGSKADVATAVRCFEKAIAVDPKNYVAHIELARQLIFDASQTQVYRAVDLTKSAFRLRPAEYSPLEILASGYHRLLRYHEAVGAYELVAICSDQCTEIKHNYPALKQLRLLYQQLGTAETGDVHPFKDKAKRLESLGTGLSSYSQFVPTYKEVIDHLTQVQQADPENPHIAWLLRAAYYKSGDNDKSKRVTVQSAIIAMRKRMQPQESKDTEWVEKEKTQHQKGKEWTEPVFYNNLGEVLLNLEHPEMAYYAWVVGAVRASMLGKLSDAEPTLTSLASYCDTQKDTGRVKEILDVRSGRTGLVEYFCCGKDPTQYVASLKSKLLPLNYPMTPSK